MTDDILLDIGGIVLTRHDNFVVQVRAGVMTHEIFGAVEAHVRRLGASVKGPIGFVAVLDEGAEVPPQDVRKRQKELIAHMLEVTDLRMAAFIAGDGLGASLRRTVARMIVPGHGQVRVVGSVRDAAAWVAPHVGHAASVLERSIGDAREIAARSRES